jgi:ribose transport system permease protein
MSSLADTKIKWQPRWDARITGWIRADNSVVAIVAVMFIVMCFAAPHFFSVTNFMNILQQNAPLMLVALGTTFVILAGAFDLSSGQALSLSGVLGAWFALKLNNAVLGVLLGIAIGIPCGVINGFIVGKLRVNSFLATLATSLVFGGLALLVVGGASIDLTGTAFTWLGSTSVGVVPVSVIVTGVVFVLLSLLLRVTVIGRQVFAVGSNPEAARLSGVSIARVTTFAYVVGGMTAALGGLIITTQTGVASTYDSANQITLDAIAAVVIGGTSITGGRGAVWRTVFGVLLLALIQNALDLLDVVPYWQEIVSGLIILSAIVANSLSLRVRT